MCKALNHTLNRLLGSVGIARDLVAHLDDGAPVLGGEVLVGRLGCGAKQLLAIQEQKNVAESVYSYFQRL